MHRVTTDNKSVTSIVGEIIALTGWVPPDP
jgi:hypothetical protein